jgi:hypothetical protein
MKGVFIPDVTIDEFRNTCLEGIEGLLAEGTILDMDADAMRPRADWTRHDDPEEGAYYECGCCGVRWALESGTLKDNEMNYCPKCGAVVEEADNGSD